MSDSLANASFDEDKYANDSFETEVPESSLYGSEADYEETNRVSSANVKKITFTRTGEFMTCESSSDEDDVILGQTIAEINNETLGFDDEDDDDLDEDIDEEDVDAASLTPAQRLFQLASATRRQQKSNAAALHGYPTPPDSKENVDENEDDEIDDENCDYADDYELSDCEEFENLENESNVAEAQYRQYVKALATDEEFNYEEEEIIFGSGVKMQDAYENISIEDGGEVDVGEPNFNDELAEDDVQSKRDASDDDDDETEAARSEQASISLHTETEEEACASAKEASAALDALEEQLKANYEDEAAQSPSAKDSMESFKRRVMLSQRMRCQSENGGGDCAGAKAGRVKSGIPVWTGGSFRIHGRQAAASSAASLPEFAEKSETEFSEKNIDAAAGGDYNSLTDMGSSCGVSTTYEKELQRFLKSGKPQKPPKKLKPGERRNKSFSNERLRDIERSNHILLRKIINQKPTVSFNDKKKKLDKFANLPPTKRTSSAEINRKKQERQIDLDNQLLRRKLDAILQRKPKKSK